MSASGLLAHSDNSRTQEDIPLVGTHEGEPTAKELVSGPEVEETVKNSMKDRRTTNKGKDKMLQASHEETQVPQKPRTRSTTKNMIKESTSKKTIELPNDVPEQFEVGGQEFGRYSQ